MTNAIKYVAGVSIIALAGLALSSKMERNAIFGDTDPTYYPVSASGDGTEIPFGHPWFTLTSGHSITWVHVDDFYRNTVEAERGEPYFQALQSEVIGYLVRETYSGNVPEERRRYYLRELTAHPYVAKPDVALSLVQSLWDEGGPIDTELYNLSQGIEANNRAYLGEDAFASHYLMFKDTYAALERLGNVD